VDRTIFIKPARRDLVVRDPATAEALPAEGALRPRSSYWMRRLRDGDVVEAKPAKRGTRKSEES